MPASTLRRFSLAGNLPTCCRGDMAVDLRETLPHGERLWKVPVKVRPTRLLSFTFVPILKKLPIKSEVTRRGKSRVPLTTSYEHSDRQGPDQSMSEEGVFKAEIVYIGDSDDNEAGSRWAQTTPDDLSVKDERPAEFQMSADHMTVGSAVIAPLPPRAENAVPHINTGAVPTLSALDATHSDRRAAPQLCQDVSPRANISSASVDGAWEATARDALTLPSEAPKLAGLCSSPASSRESIFSEDGAKSRDYLTPRTLSPEGSLGSLSRTESPCSSVRSGAFSPSVVRVERRSLAPGSSLLQAAESPSPASPSSRAAHKLPPSRLSLLTAILRKGRLPLLSVSPARPYSPCWPISPASVSSCAACSAASSLSSLWPGTSRTQAPGPSDKPPPALPPHASLSPSLLTVSMKATGSPSRKPTMNPPPRFNPFQVAPVQNHMAPSPDPGRPPSSQAKTAPPPPAGTPETLSRTPSPAQLSMSPSMSPVPNGTSCFPLASLSIRVTPALEESGSTSSSLHSLQNGVPAPPAWGPTPPPRWSSMSLPLPDQCSLRPSSVLSAPGRLTQPPSPPLSLPSSSSALDWSPTRGGRKKKYKIKSSYKALAAIPTNTILLEQQAIDERVDNETTPVVQADHDRDGRAEICSPAQLRQESEELYAAIDEVLENPMPMRRSRSVPWSLVKCVNSGASKPSTSAPRPAGRETKYAIFHMQRTGPLEKNQTKPGVIRPVTVVPKQSEEGRKEEFQPNPFRKYLEEALKDKQLEAGLMVEGSSKPRDPAAGPPSPALRITEEDGRDHQTGRDGSAQHAPTSFGTHGAKTQVQETHM